MSDLRWSLLVAQALDKVIQDDYEKGQLLAYMYQTKEYGEARLQFLAGEPEVALSGLLDLVVQVALQARNKGPAHA